MNFLNDYKLTGSLIVSNNQNFCQPIVVEIHVLIYLFDRGSLHINFFLFQWKFKLPPRNHHTCIMKTDGQLRKRNSITVHRINIIHPLFERYKPLPNSVAVGRQAIRGHNKCISSSVFRVQRSLQRKPFVVIENHTKSDTTPTRRLVSRISLFLFFLLPSSFFCRAFHSCATHLCSRSRSRSLPWQFTGLFDFPRTQ